MTSDNQQLDLSLNAVDDNPSNDKQLQSEEEPEEASAKLALENAVVSATTDGSVSSSSFTNSTCASINSRTTLGVNNNSSTSAAGRQQRRVLAFQLDGAVHRRSNASKNPIQMLSNLFSSMMGERSSARKYGIKRQILQRTRSSLRRPQLVSLRSRGSIYHQQGDMVDMDNNGGCSSNGRENAFDMLLRFCDKPADIAFLRNHPDHMERLGIPVEQYSTILEELNFFLIKREQLREAEQRVRQRKQKREKK